MLDHQSILQAYQQVRQRLTSCAEACGRDPASITLVAVSKTQATEKIRILAEAGHQDFGESYAQELIVKAETLKSHALNWHFIGRVQTNKLAKLLPHLACAHAIDSYDHALAIAGQLQKSQAASPSRHTPFPIYLAVNIGQEPQKTGVRLDEVATLAERIQTSISEVAISGIMAIPPVSFSDENFPAGLPREYERLRDLAPSIGGGKLSLGMSADMRLAIAAGSTCLRIGTAIFGARN